MFVAWLQLSTQHNCRRTFELTWFVRSAAFTSFIWQLYSPFPVSRRVSLLLHDFLTLTLFGWVKKPCGASQVNSQMAHCLGFIERTNGVFRVLWLGFGVKNVTVLMFQPIGWGFAGAAHSFFCCLTAELVFVCESALLLLSSPPAVPHRLPNASEDSPHGMDSTARPRPRRPATHEHSP